MLRKQTVHHLRFIKNPPCHRCMTGESGFRTFLCQHGPDCVQREAGGAQRPSGGFLRKAAVERACVGQPADGTERLLAGFFGKSCAEEERGFEFLRVTERGGFCRPAGGLRPGLRTMSMTSARTALAVAGPPAPGPENRTAPTLLPSTSTAFRTPETGASGCVPAMNAARRRR